MTISARSPRLCLAALVSLFLATFVVLRAAEGRTETSLNAGWRFHFGAAPGAEAAGFDASQWTPVTLPHTWNALDGQDGVKVPQPGGSLLHGDYARGDGWYRRTLSPEAAWAGRRLYLQFDGANRRTDVFVNGQPVGTHLGGQARFRLDITSFLRLDRDNVLAVKVNNEGNGIAPESADFTFFGGLYRDVALLVTDPVQIETMDHGSAGVFLSQVNVTPELAEVKARIELANHDAQPAELAVRLAIVDASGKTVAEARTSTTLAANATGEVALPITLASPHLWNGRADPYLYTARVELSRGGKVRDVVEQPLGLRFFRVDAAQGFLLNGRYLDLRGVSRHQDRQDKGWAISPADEREDMSLITEMGSTAIRVAHYQQSPLWYRLADEQGLVLWAEIPFVDEALPTELFAENAREQMRELIRQNYNHPAIFFWGCGNENFDAGVGFASGIAKYGPVSEHLIQSLHDLAHAEDPTRLTTYASFHSEKDVHLALPGQPPVDVQGEPQRWYTDLTAFNKYYGWYYGEPEDNAEFFDSLHTRNPTQRLAVSEYGAGGSVHQHETKRYGTPRVDMEKMRGSAFAPFHPEEYQASYHERTWAALKARPYLWAKFIWNMFDFASDGRKEGDEPGRNDKGLVTFDRKTRKDAFYFYKANWSTSPVLYLASRRYTERVNPVTDVKVYTNAADAELFVNGHTLGRRPGRDGIVLWPDVTLLPGENRIKVAATIAGAPLTDECAWTVIPAGK